MKHQDKQSGNEEQLVSMGLGPRRSAKTEHVQVYVFSKRKMYRTRYHKYWIVRHGEPLPSPPSEADARRCPGPALFINVPTNGEKQIWLWNTEDGRWDPIGIGHIINLDVKRVLTLSEKNAPVFRAVRDRQDRRDGLQFIQCQP